MNIIKIMARLEVKMALLITIMAIQTVVQTPLRQMEALTTMVVNTTVKIITIRTMMTMVMKMITTHHLGLRRICLK